ncbi:pyrroline-5-carboxylate reductase [Prochlorococcus marinus str. MIT 9312]|uniref:Pyrroline-5-carboxylate reductase n=1 Tax=Prochlorococcus marinus (strain MIT 9312) TaxID=74546 RepID=Q31CE2_PROM9|nr:pyrroline-5-carboxylate reductase [Prochlorococcus marinus]ABB49453.1 pyrroline-5-carboxylate reductase [Prochlorococcus marinus str. MIT 9312]KGG00768.1 Pyrroline-5-carboxylate reductase [Prochlorococcus marinus str. MIT 9311]
MTDKIAIIGFGNIANAIITPLFDKNLIQPERVYCVVNSEKSLENIKKNYKYNINVYKSGSKESEIIWDCQFKLLSIKPQHLKDITEGDIIKNKNNLLVSILAGVSINKLHQKFPNHKCVRVVTNIPITVGKGLTGIAWGENLTEDQKEFTKKLFENTSKIYEFTEEYLDIFLALTSSGPAIIALIIESLSDGGLSGGLPKILSEELVMEMIIGTISLIKEKKLTTSELKNLVTSPGGTTISALRVLEKKGVRSALIESIVSASNRSKEFS